MPETKKYMLAIHEDPQRFLQHVHLYFSLNSQKKKKNGLVRCKRDTSY